MMCNFVALASVLSNVSDQFIRYMADQLCEPVSIIDLDYRVAYCQPIIYIAFNTKYHCSRGSEWRDGLIGVLGFA